jgi:hypothetical protein
MTITLLYNLTPSHIKPFKAPITLWIEINLHNLSPLSAGFI